MNTKLIVLALLALCASSMSVSLGLGKRIECMKDPKGAETRLFESQIRKIIEQVREMLLNGVNGCPPLDPLDITDFKLNINNQLMNLTSTLDIQSTGLAGFKVTKLSLSMLLMKLKFGFKFPQVTAKGRYNIDLATPGIPQPIVGDGSFDGVANDFKFSGVCRVYTKLSHGRMIIQISKLEVDMSLDKFAVQLTGLMNDEQLSKEISQRLTNELPTIIAENKGRLNQAIKDALPYVNRILAEKSFASEQVRC